MDDNDTSTHLLCRLISFQIAVAQKLAWESHRVKWKMWKQSWDFRTFGIHKVEVLRHLRTLPTVPAMSHGDVCRRSADLVIWLNVINVTEHSSLPSLPTPFAKWLLLSSPCRMEIGPGFSPRGLAMPHCGTACLVLNFPINSFNQHLFARAGRCRAMTSRCTFWDRQVQPGLDSRETDSWRSSVHTWMRMTLVRTCYLQSPTEL